jgi:hypothetical protein
MGRICLQFSVNRYEDEVCRLRFDFKDYNLSEIFGEKKMTIFMNL